MERFLQRIMGCRHKFRKFLAKNISARQIDLIRDARHLCTRLRTDLIKALGGKQVIKFSNTRNRGRVCLFLTTGNEKLFILGH